MNTKPLEPPEWKRDLDAKRKDYYASCRNDPDAGLEADCARTYIVALEKAVAKLGGT